MNKEERITYEEFMIMFKNAPRIAYTLYDKAEDEIERLNNIINELEKELDKGFEVYICNGRKVSKSIELGYKICQKELLRKLKALKEGKE